MTLRLDVLFPLFQLSSLFFVSRVYSNRFVIFGCMYKAGECTWVPGVDCRITYGKRESVICMRHAHKHFSFKLGTVVEGFSTNFNAITRSFHSISHETAAVKPKQNWIACKFSLSTLPDHHYHAKHKNVNQLLRILQFFYQEIWHAFNFVNKHFDFIRWAAQRKSKSLTNRNKRVTNQIHTMNARSFFGNDSNWFSTLNSASFLNNCLKSGQILFCVQTIRWWCWSLSKISDFIPCKFILRSWILFPHFPYPFPYSQRESANFVTNEIVMRFRPYHWAIEATMHNVYGIWIMDSLGGKRETHTKTHHPHQHCRHRHGPNYTFFLFDSHNPLQSKHVSHIKCDKLQHIQMAGN